MRRNSTDTCSGPSSRVASGILARKNDFPSSYNLHAMALRVVRAFRDGLRDGLLVFFVGVVLLRVAAAVYFLTHLLVAAAPVVMLASLIAVSGLASNTSRRGVGQWGGAGGAVCEDHFCLAPRRLRVGRVYAGDFLLLVSYAR